MKNLDVALCDFDSNYIIKFANHLMEKSGVSVHIFTTPEGFFADGHDFDVTVLTEEFEEITGFRPKGSVGRKYILVERRELSDENHIYKYQSVDILMDGIQEIKSLSEKHASTIKSNENSKFVGIYSPACHELQLPFSMALGQAYRTMGNVLFLDLEEISILSSFIGKSCERNLMDLLYEISTGEKVDIRKYTRSFMGFDYIEPFQNPNEISEIDEETWSNLFRVLAESEYETVVILFGRTINGFSRLIEDLNKLFILGRPGDYFRKSQDAFMDYLARINASIEIENVVLPMSAGNLSEGTYQLEELMQGNLGAFVRRLMTNRIKNALENYG